MIIIEKSSNIKSKEDFIKSNKENDILLIYPHITDFSNMMFFINTCAEIDNSLTIEIGSNYFFISKHNPESRATSNSFLSNRTYKDIIAASFEN